MATMTVSLPDPMKDWIEDEVRKGDYATTSDFMRELVRRERDRRQPVLTIEELRRILAEASAAGPGKRSIKEILDEGDRILKERDAARG